MPKIHLKNFGILVLFLLFAGSYIAKAQDISAESNSLVFYFLQLEKKFDVKFSFVDEDLKSLTIAIPKTESLKEILIQIEKATQLKIKKLNNRYYTITKSTTVDICAYIFDNYQNNTISGVSIEVLGSKIAITTDSLGLFSLTNIPRKSNLRIRHLGFKTKFINAEELANQTPCKIISLSEFHQELDEVILYKFLTTGLSKQQDGSITLNIEDFGILPGLIEPDILQTVQALPGIKSIDETVSDINIRGGTNDQNLILWDGIKMYQSGHFFGLISAFNPYLTDKVTIIKNGTSAMYGDGISGVISMQSKNEISNSIFGGAGFNLISGDAYGHIPFSNKLAFQFSGRRSITDFLNTPTYSSFFDKVFQDSAIKSTSSTNDIVQNDGFYFYDFTAKLLYDISTQQKIRLSFISINNTLEYSESSNNTNREILSTLNQTNLSFGGSLESDWNENFTTFFNAYYTQYNLDANNVFNDVQQLYQHNQVFETAFKLHSNYQFSNTINWNNGYQFSEIGITNIADVTQPPYVSKIKDVIRSHSIFSEIQYNSSNNKLKARFGGRLNLIHNLESPVTQKSFTEFIPEPRLNLTYKITDLVTAELQGEFKNQTTNQVIDLEQNFLGIEKRRWILSDNDSLPITRSKQIALGVNYDKKDIYIGLEGFYKEVTGISTATQGFQNQNQFNGEIGKYDVTGIEFLINKKTASFSTWLSYTYSINEYTFKDITPSQFPNNIGIKHLATLASTYTYKNIKVGVGLNYRSGKPYTKPQEGENAINTLNFPNTINYTNPNSSLLPYYLRADASVIYNFNTTSNIKYSLGVSVLNILNRNNILKTYYRLNEDNEIETIETASLDLTPNFSFRMRF
ncbi:MAG: TonB-dependent receptor plug domain-containing protein [Cellulophaga sp.]